jgi:hypothetical protein
MSNRIHRAALGVLVAVGALIPSRPTDASELAFGPNDAQTVFFISRSNDTSRVDYAIRLDPSCVPVNNDAVFGYWREFEGTRTKRVHGFAVFDYFPYGIADQRLVQRLTDGAVYFLRLRQFSRPVTIVTTKGQDGRCYATGRTTIGSVEAELLSVHVTLASFASVDFIDIRGKSLTTGSAVTERVKN